eukprot:20301-Prorocentrum_minimum.AAC.1
MCRAAAARAAGGVGAGAGGDVCVAGGGVPERGTLARGKSLQHQHPLPQADLRASTSVRRSDQK